MRILTTPWKTELLELTSAASKSIKITSPFIKKDICSEVLSAKGDDTKLEIITSFKLSNLYSGALDIDAIDNILSIDGTVKNHPKLHSKIYIFDDSQAVITSGNLTFGGVVRNFEYGILLTDSLIVKQMVSDFTSLSENENTGVVNKSHVDIVREILSKIPITKHVTLPTIEVDTPEEILDTVTLPENVISETLRGWKRDVFECVNNLSQLEFTLQDVYGFEQELALLHPDNSNIKDKIRQQLQYLRDIGLVEFRGAGNYKKLWKV